MDDRHDKLATRLVQIILKLNEGGGFNLSELAEEFGVNTRTIQRDLKRLSFLPLEKRGGRYYLASYAMGHIGFENLKDFLRLCGIEKLFPSLENKDLKDFFNPDLRTSLLIQPAYFEKIKSKEFKELQTAILDHQVIQFFYKDKERQIHPYRLTHHLGRWYLLGVEGEHIKSFALDKIKTLKVCTQIQFEPDAMLIQEIENNRFHFISKEKNEIILFVDRYAMPYFEKQSLLPNQKILNKTSDGMEVYIQSSYDEEILRTIQQWMPHIFILSPENLKEQLKERIEKYLKIL